MAMQSRHVEKGAILVHSYHGQNRIKDLVRLREFDVILTTYSTVASESTNSPLQRLEFFRIVLDEGMKPSKYLPRCIRFIENSPKRTSYEARKQNYSPLSINFRRVAVGA
jgi:SNF2 family DNA or RNA helicase